ncbi:hypothetical protein A2U01_0090680, partial [Trifolium medium]|nr:hypothetical protein [Trifolium medium]
MQKTAAAVVCSGANQTSDSLK